MLMLVLVLQLDRSLSLSRLSEDSFEQLPTKENLPLFSTCPFLSLFAFRKVQITSLRPASGGKCEWKYKFVVRIFKKKLTILTFANEVSVHKRCESLKTKLDAKAAKAIGNIQAIRNVKLSFLALCKVL